MARKLSSLAITAVLLFALAPSAWAEGPVAWDKESSEELKHALHNMHEVWNTGDIAALKNLMIGDDVLTTFELDPNDHTPIRLPSKAAINEFVDNVVVEIDDQSAITELEMPELNCRATDSWGVCTEECTVHFKSVATGELIRTDKLWSTAVAVKYEDGWKWIQWHMSEGSAPEQIDAPMAAQ